MYVCVCVYTCFFLSVHPCISLLLLLLCIYPGEEEKSEKRKYSTSKNKKKKYIYIYIVGVVRSSRHSYYTSLTACVFLCR